MPVVSARNLVIGFLAGAAAVVAVHQLVLHLLSVGGLIRAEPWSLRPVAPLGLPMLLSAVLWGGVWGMVYALAGERLPGRGPAVRGLALGLAALVLGDWLVVPLVKGGALFAGFSLPRMLAGVLALGAFGMATAAFAEQLRAR